LRDGKGGFVHQQLVTRLLSDCFGIQTRGGCACAGPYVHRILDIGKNASDAMRDEILSGNEIEKPGFVRLNFSYLATDSEVNSIISAVLELADSAGDHVEHYSCDPTTAIFIPTKSSNQWTTNG
jgi:selenocysteine lyase/cysteine desulfurase